MMRSGLLWRLCWNLYSLAQALAVTSAVCVRGVVVFASGPTRLPQSLWPCGSTMPPTPETLCTQQRGIFPTVVFDPASDFAPARSHINVWDLAYQRKQLEQLQSMGQGPSVLLCACFPPNATDAVNSFMGGGLRCCYMMECCLHEAHELA